MSGVRAVLFDLDDTLFPEMDFVRSGFRAVSRHLSSRLGVSEGVMFESMLGVLAREGRGHVFDSVLRSLGAEPTELVDVCVYLYRWHRPDIVPYADAIPVLRRLRDAGVRLGIVTDGMGAVQRGKIEALGLDPLVDAVVCSDLLGPEKWKPSGEAYRVALSLLGARPEESAYVGDNPVKDFVWPNAAGMLTIRIRRGTGSSADLEGVPDSGRARLEVESLAAIPPYLER